MGRAIHEPDAQVHLELAQCPRQHGLGQVQRGSGPRDVAFLGDRQEGAQVPQLHCHVWEA